jgi:putative aminopeptidase FrvX
MLDMLETMKALVAPVLRLGREAEIARVIRGLAAPYADECETDTLGSLIVRKKGPARR